MVGNQNPGRETGKGRDLQLKKRRKRRCTAVAAAQGSTERVPSLRSTSARQGTCLPRSQRQGIRLLSTTGPLDFLPLLHVTPLLMPISSPTPGSIIANQIRMSTLLNWKAHAHFSLALRGIKTAGHTGYRSIPKQNTVPVTLVYRTGTELTKKRKGRVLCFVLLKCIKWGRVLNYNSADNSNYHFDFNFITLIMIPL